MDSHWDTLLHSKPSPHFLSYGRVPAPIPSDSYAEKWMKLVWMELQAEVANFLSGLKPNSSSFASECDLSLTVEGNAEKTRGEGSTGKELSVEITGRNESDNFKLPPGSDTPFEFVHGLLKLKHGLGWMYMIGVDLPMNDPSKTHSALCEHKGPVFGTAIPLHESFKCSTVDALKDLKKEPCVLFSRFSSVLTRIKALQYRKGPCSLLVSMAHYLSWSGHNVRTYSIDVGFVWAAATVASEFSIRTVELGGMEAYESVSKGVRVVIENPAQIAGTNVAGVSTLIVPNGNSSKLNDTQQKILASLRSPVDFVQGPPGTGKSTFIVELLQTRIPAAQRVLICTTTNRAIDSLTEKILSSGIKEVIAIGNPVRLGATSLSVTVDARMNAHQSVKAATKLYNEAVRASTIWDDALSEACVDEDEEFERTGSIVKRSSSLRLIKVNSEDVDSLYREATYDFGQLEKTINKSICKRLLHLQDLLADLLLLSHPPAFSAYIRLVIHLAHAEQLAGLPDVDIDELLDNPLGIRDHIQRIKLFAFRCLCKVKVEMRLSIVASARCFVCTASSAVKLQERMWRTLVDDLNHVPFSSAELSSINKMQATSQRQAKTGSQRPSLLDSITQHLSNLSLGSIARPVSQLFHKREERQQNTVQKRNEEIQKLLSGLMCFKYVILDEAGAMLEPDTVGTIIHGCEFLLLVGDHRQLPPFTTWNEGKKWKYDVSLLQRIVETDKTCCTRNLMTHQYRMHPKIASIVSDVFYGGQLVTPMSVVERRQRVLAATFIDIAGEERRINSSYTNHKEAHAVVRLVLSELKATKVNRIDVLTFYSGQRNLIRDCLESAGIVSKKEGQQNRDANKHAQLVEKERVDVMTVDSMQGREADVIILSCVRAGKRTNSVGFMKCSSRINVALSRAKEQLYIVGSYGKILGRGGNHWKDALMHENLYLDSNDVFNSCLPL